MFFPVILVCASILVPVGPAHEAPVGAVPFSTNDVVEQMTHRRERTALGSSILGPWEYPTSALLQEFMIDTSITYVSALEGQHSASVASDGATYFVVWGDWRVGPSRIFGARVDSSGRVLDPGALVISVRNYQYNPSVAFGLDSYLVVWDQGGPSTSDIYGVLVDTSGAVLSPSPIPICTTQGPQSLPAVSFDGANYFVVWDDGRSPGEYDIYGARVSSSGDVLDHSGIAICTADSFQLNPSVASDGSGYLVVWEDVRSMADYDIYGARVDTSGNLLDTAGIPVCTNAYDQQSPSVSYCLSRYLVVWHDGRNAVDSDIYGSRIDTSGAVLDTSGIAISTRPDDQIQPSLISDGASCLVVWVDEEGADSYIRAARVDTSGTVLDPTALTLYGPTSDIWQTSVAFGTEVWLVVWSVWDSGSEWDVYGTRADTSGALLDSSALEISGAANEQRSPSVAPCGENYLVVWHDWRSSGGWDVYGARVDATGAVLDPMGFPISSMARREWYPWVGSRGPNCLVVWIDSRNLAWELYGARVDTLGTVLDPTGICISSTLGGVGYSAPRVVYSEPYFLVVWEDDRNGNADIYGARVDTSGIVLDPSGIAICDESGNQRLPSVGSDGRSYLAVWTDFRDGAHPHIRGTRIDTSGMVLDSSGIIISDTVESEYGPSLAFDGSNHLVVWTRDWDGPDTDIYGARVDGSGNVLDSPPIPISRTFSYQRSPSVVFDGNYYFVVWEDRRDYPEPDIYGARVTTSGEVLDPSGLELINEPDQYRMLPTAAKGFNDKVLLAFEGFVPGRYNSYRALGAFYTGVGIEEKSRKSKTATAKLLQNRPNPFHTRTTIQYQIPAVGLVSLKIYDSSGRLVSVLADGQKAAGYYTTTWDGRDASGLQVSSGIYFCLLEAGGFTSVSKMTFLQ